MCFANPTISQSGAAQRECQSHSPQAPVPPPRGLPAHRIVSCHYNPITSVNHPCIHFTSRCNHRIHLTTRITPTTTHQHHHTTPHHVLPYTTTAPHNHRTAPHTNHHHQHLQPYRTLGHPPTPFRLPRLARLFAVSPPGSPRGVTSLPACCRGPGRKPILGPPPYIYEVFAAPWVFFA